MFEDEVYSQSPHMLSDADMDAMLKANLAMWLQNKVI